MLDTGLREIAEKGLGALSQQDLLALAVAPEDPSNPGELVLEAGATSWLDKVIRPEQGERREEHRAAVAVFRQLFNSLESNGLGKYVYGRHGRPSRFRWHEGLTTGEVRSLAHGRVESHDRRGKDRGPHENPRPDSGKKTNSLAPRLRVWRFPLRPDLEIKLQLPPDLSPDEARRLGKFIESLCF
jgi:hypothetical protein